MDWLLSEQPREFIAEFMKSNGSIIPIQRDAILVDVLISKDNGGFVPLYMNKPYY